MIEQQTHIFDFDPIGRNLVSDLHKEMIRNFNIDVEYMVRDEVSVDKIFGEDTRSKFSTSRKIEMYVESADGFEGSDVILGQIGLEIDQTAEFTVSIERFREVFDDLNFLEPREGDVLYIRFAEDDTANQILEKDWLSGRSWKSTVITVTSSLVESINDLDL